MAAGFDQLLGELAEAHGVQTWYEDWRRERVDIDQDVVRAVLGLMSVDVSGSAAVRRELAEVRRRRGAGGLPAIVAVREKEVWRLPGAVAEEHDGGTGADPGSRGELREGQPVPLPPGRYRLTSRDSASRDSASRDSAATLLVAPARLPAPPAAWGWMLQLYALHSAGSWGIGDFGDLSGFARWAGRTGGAGLILLNPLHAVATRPRVQASPYSPSSRGYTNPIYLRISDTDAYRAADGAVRAAVDALRPNTDRSGDGGHLIDDRHLIDHDTVWRAKQEALELLWPYAERTDLDALARDDPGLLDFATFRALAEVHGEHFPDWPGELHRPDAPAVARARRELAHRVAFHAWQQRLCRAQLGAAQDAAREAGMPIGLVHDLAVGVDPGGADAWMLRDQMAQGVHVGAPPDPFNQLGQDWGLAPWRPDRLAATGYAAYQHVLRGVLAHAGGIRVDHVAALWRLWWIPPGARADQGTYVRYDARAMLAVLAMEAERAGAVVVGEDLGTVEPRVTEALRDENMLGCSVLWFCREQSDGSHPAPFLAPESWPERSMASISTHDLPTAAGMLAGEHVRVRAELGVLSRDVTVEAEQAADDRRELIELLVREGLLRNGRNGESDSPSDEDLVFAMHRLLARTPCRLLMASPYDVLGEVRQPNLPGTTDQYPNWRMPLPVPLELLREDPRMHAVAALFSEVR